MQVHIENLPKSKIKIKVSVPFDEFKDFIDLAYQNLSENIKIDGFRKGKIPKEILEKHVGQYDLYQELSKIVVEKTYPEIVEKNNLNVIELSKIQITKIIPKQEIEYCVDVSVMPKIENLNYLGIKVKKQEISVNQREIDDAVLWLRKSRARYLNVDRPAQFGDFVSIDFESYIDGVLVEGGSDKNHQFILGEGKFLAGFEKELEGLKVGEKKEFNLRVSNDYYHKILAGKVVNFKVKMNSVQQIELPEMTDEFVKTLGNFNNVEALLGSIKEGLIQEKEVAEKERIRKEILDELEKRNLDFEIPEVLINNEIENIKLEFKANLSQYGIDFNKYLLDIKENENSFSQKLYKEAERRIRRALILQEIAKRENIEVDEQELESEILKILRNPQLVSQLKLKNIDDEKLRDYTRNIIRTEKTLQFLERESTK